MRTKNGILNFLSSYIFYFIIAILGILKVRIFITSLGEDIFALNQVYINLFSYISVLEAGFGSALMYRLYKHLNNKNYNEINRLYSGTVDIFKKIGIGMIIIGFILSFFIQFIIKENNFNLIFLVVTFMLFVLKNVIDYFMFVPRYVVTADNKSYKFNVIMYSFKTLEILVEILLLYQGFNYILILIPSSFIAIIQNVIINNKIKKDYPWLKNVKNKNYEIKKDVNSLIIHRIAGLISNNIDIVLLSSFVGTESVVVYGSYNYIIKYTVDTSKHIFYAIKDGIGSIVATNDEEKIKKSILQTNTIFSFFAVLMIILLFFVLNKFVIIWIGGKYSASTVTLILFLLMLYHNLTVRSSHILSNILGIFKETKKMLMATALVNLVISFALVKGYGINGVLIGTIIASFGIESWGYAYHSAKKLFNKFDVLFWLGYHLKNILIILLTISIVYLFSMIMPFVPKSLTMWFVYSLIYGIIILLIVIGMFNLFYRKEFLYLERRFWETIKDIFKNKITRRK